MNQLLRLQGHRQPGGGEVGTDAVHRLAAVRSLGHRGYDRGVILGQEGLQDGAVHPDQLAGAAGGRPGGHQAAVNAAQADGLGAQLVQGGHQALVHLAAQDLLKDLHGLRPDLIDPLLLDQLPAGLGQSLLHLRADAVDQHHLDAYQTEHGNIRGHRVPQLRVHGHAAAVDHHDLSVVALDIGQRLC